jgi:integrase
MNKSDQPQKRRDSDGLHKRRGYWEFTLTIDGRRRAFSTHTKVLREAREIRNEAIKKQLENKLPTNLARARFEQVLAKVLEDREPHLSESSIRCEQERSKPLLDHFAGRRVNEITGDAIREYQRKRLEKVGPRTINLEARLIRHTLRAAKIWATVSDDYKNLKEDRRGPGRALTEDQLKLLFNTAKARPHCDAAFYASIVASNTTARSIELKSLRIADVDLLSGVVRIGRSKTDAGKRTVPLNPASQWAFARLLERANALGSTSPEHYLFPRFLYKTTKAEKRGAGYLASEHQKTWRTAWRSLVRATAKLAGDDAAAFRGLRFHDLRHCAITCLAESGASDQTIMALAGHLDRSMLEHYSHIRMAAKRKAVAAIKSAFEIPADEPLPATKTVQ